MESNLPWWIVAIYLVAVLAAQTGVDLYFTRPLLPGSARQRAVPLLVGGAAGMGVTLLAFRLVLPLNHAFLLASREKGTMAIGVLAVVLEYFAWIFPFILIKGWVVREWLSARLSRERRQAWWSYVFIGALATLLLAAPLFLAVTVIPPLITGVEDRFGG